MKKLWDKVLLIGISLLVVLVACGSFWIGEIYQVNPRWIFFAGNSIFAIPMLWKPFHNYLRRPGFVIFFLVWITIHGAIVATMTFWLPALLWLPIILLELTAGFLVAKWIIGEPLTKDNEDEDGGAKSLEP